MSELILKWLMNSFDELYKGALLERTLQIECSKRKTGNACHHSVQNLLSSGLLSRYIGYTEL
jgi:hypothetical protein